MLNLLVFQVDFWIFYFKTVHIILPLRTLTSTVR